MDRRARSGDRVAVAAVPFGPGHPGEPAHLVETTAASQASAIIGALGQDRRRLERPGQRRIGDYARRVAGEDAGEVEAEAVDAEALDPVLEAVDDVVVTSGWLQLTVLPQPVKSR